MEGGGGEGAEFCLTTEHLLGGNPRPSDWAKFFSGPLASQNFLRRLWRL